MTETTNNSIPSQQRMLQCQEAIKPYIHETPVLTSKSLSQELGAELFFKCENFQRAGSFKIRGASHAIVRLDEEQRSKGVVAHSSGNFAQAIALAAASVGTNACIAMPSNAPQVKMDATRSYGGEIVVCEPTAEDRERQADRIVAERGATFVHPSNDINVILGQGTAAMEFFRTNPDLDYLFVPVGGGGLIAGCSLAARYFGEHCKTIGAEPYAVDDAFRSLASGQIEQNETTDTIADGLRTFLGDQNFPIIQECVDRIVRVTEDEIRAAMQVVWHRMKIVIEPSAAVTYAAVLKERELLAGKKVGVIVSGGNVDFTQFNW